MDIDNSQLQVLKAQGLTIDEISVCLGLSREAVELALTMKPKQSFEELLEKHRPAAVKVLADIMHDDTYSDGARVKAAQVILTGKGEMPAISSTRLSIMFEEMKKVIAAHEMKVIPQEAMSLSSKEESIKTEDSLEMAGCI